ncbi:hypothetical protein ABVK25_010534 [Lepraria finkii]|uniref:Uncharacterized protein n=1 Tax=Lepraria finkii TaxID=1340010 RepID=A0ABR4AU07_9LECA
MSGSLGMTSILLLILLLTVVHASSYENQSTAINTDQNVLVDCSACWPVNSIFNHSTSLRASTVVSAANATSGLDTGTLASITPAPQISVTVEENWCENEDPKEDGIKDLFKGLNASSKNSCLSLEKENYTTWATARRHQSTRNSVISPPSCDTYCNIQASAAQLHYWPTISPAPNVTTSVGQGGFTL